jgi:MFS family permease
MKRNFIIGMPLFYSKNGRNAPFVLSKQEKNAYIYREPFPGGYLMNQKFHKTNLALWLTIIVFMLILGGIVFYLDSSYFIKPHESQKTISDVFFLIALVLAIAIFIFKRAFFLPLKLVHAVEHEHESEKLTKIMARIRRNYMVIWSLAELIFLLGFIQYILTANFRQFLILSVVAFYSLVINKPQENLSARCEEYLSDNSDI